MKGLLIGEPWVGMVYDGEKNWELRGRRTQQRGEIALIESGTGTVVGLTTLVDVVGPLSKAELLRSLNRHRVAASKIRAKLPYATTYAWVFEGSKWLRRPVPYSHPPGAVIWVNLSPEVSRKVGRARYARSRPAARRPSAAGQCRAARDNLRDNSPRIAGLIPFLCRPYGGGRLLRD